MAVRRESVLLTLEDQFSSGMARAAAATALLNRNLHDLDGTSTDAGAGVRRLGDDTDDTSNSLRRAGTDIDKFSGRLRVLADLGLTAGTALVPLGAAGATAVAGLAAQFAALAGGIGVSVLALNGVGDGLKALNAFQLEPTTANLEKMHQEFDRIGPAGEQFVRYLDSVTPQLRELQDVARDGMLPGVADGIDAFLSRGGELKRIVGDLSGAMGELAQSAGEALGGPRFDAFFRYLDTDAGPLLLEFGRSIGYVGEGFANLIVAFKPLSSDFSGGLLEMTRSFAEWSRGLQDNDSFQEFLDYLRENGPAAVDFLGSLVKALASVIEAAAPIGQAVLPGLTALLDVFAGIAGTPVGTTLLGVAAAFTAFNRASAVLDGVNGRLVGLTDNLGRTARIGGSSIGLLALSMTDLDDQLGVANTSMGALAGMMVGGPWGAAVGAGVGAVLDLKSAYDNSTASVQRMYDVLESGSRRQISQEIDRLREALEDTEGPFNGIFADTYEMNRALAVAEGHLASTDASARLFGVGLGMTGRQMKFAASEGEELIGVIGRLNDLLDKRASVRDYESALDDFTRSVKENGRSLDLNTEKGRANEAALDNIASTAIKVAENLKGSNRVEFLRQTRADLVDAASKLDGGRTRVRRLVAEIDSLAAKKAKPKVEVDTARPTQAITEFDRKMGILGGKVAKPKVDPQTEGAFAELYRVDNMKIRDKYVNVWVTTRSVNGGGMGPQIDSARGNILHFANGDVANSHQPELYRGAMTRVWGEPETGGEAYIPLRNDSRRPRAKAIAAETVRLLGGTAHFANGGFGPNSQLFGINRDYLSASELGQRIASLTLRQLATVGEDMERLGKGPLTKLSKAFEKATSLAEKELAASKDRLDALRQERDSIAASVTARLTSTQLFGQVANSDYHQLGRPDNFNELTPEQQRDFLNAEWQFNQSLGFGQVTSPVDILRADIEKAKRERDLIQQLKSRGLSGAALQQAIMQDGGLEGAAALSQDELVQYERLTNRRDQLIGSVAGEAGNAVLGREIRDVAREVRRDREVSMQIRDQARQTTQILKRIEKIEERQADKIGDKVNGAAASGQRRRRDG